MTIDRVLEIIAPDGVTRNPMEYEIARRVAVAAIKIVLADKCCVAALEEAMNDAEKGAQCDTV